jgi:hypothetical protein
MELSKKDKKIAKQIIDIGLQREFEKGLTSFDAILQDWKDKKQDNQESYRLLYKKIAAFDKHIVNRYDYITGSKYFFVLLEQLESGIITQEDIIELSEEVVQKINSLVS